MSIRLTQVDIEYFRGATNSCTIQFDKSKPLVVVFGENGTGKSTLVDAFDLIANAEIGTIRDRSSATNKHAPAIGKKATDIKVTLHRNSDRWHGTMKGAKISVSPVGDRPLIEILRRKQLLSFVEAVPGKRYEILQRFIDVRGVEASEKSALEAVNNVKRENEEAIRKKLAAEVALTALWETNGEPGNSWSEWAASKVELSTAELEMEVEAIELILNAIRIFNSRTTAYDTAVENAQTAKDELNTIEEEIKELNSAWSTHTPSLISTLVATTALLDTEWSEQACPVCNQGIQPDELRNRVSESLASLNAAKDVYSRHQAARKVVELAEGTVETEKAQLILDAASLVDAAKKSERDDVTALPLSLPQLTASLKQDPLSGTELGKCVEDCKKIASLLESLEKDCDILNRDRNQLHTIKTEYSAWSEATIDSHETDVLVKQLEVIHEIVREKRIVFVQDILDSVASEVSRLYEAIHPDEDTKAGGLKLDPKRRASLNQLAEFAGKSNIEPQGYFSDSHLDTLGFCYWLALAMRENPESKIVVLDDVFTSVDAPHLGRIVELLDTECLHFAQMFALTHNRNWQDRYRYNQAAGRNTQLVQLRRWTPSRGLCHNKTELELDELVELLRQFTSGEEGADRQELASRCGILLEAMLSHLSQNYQCRVPHRPDGDYTLGDLITGCNSLMKVLQVQKAQDAQPGDDDASHQPPRALREVFGELCKLSFIRNQVGCHFNLAGASLTDAEVEQFGEATVVFARAIICDECGEIPRTDKSLFRQCSCKKTRLLPAKN